MSSYCARGRRSTRRQGTGATVRGAATGDKEAGGGDGDGEGPATGDEEAGGGGEGRGDGRRGGRRRR